MNKRSRLNPYPGLLPSVDAGIDGGGGTPAPAPANPDANGVWAGGIQAPTVPGVGVQQIPVPANVALLRDPVTGQFTKEALDVLEKARKEEHDKVYRTTDELTNRLKVMEDERTERLAAEQKARDEAAAAAEAARVAELSAVQRVAEIEQTTEERLQRMQGELDRRDALQAQEERFQQLQGYRAQRIQQEGALIAPPLANFVTGNSEEEIEQSIATVKATTQDMFDAVVGENQVYRQQMRGVAPTGMPPVGPMDSASGQTTVTADDISKMDPATYAANRNALMAAARQSGPYGRR